MIMQTYRHKPSASRSVIPADDALSVKAAAFVASYIEHGNATRAYRQAFDTSAMLPATIKRKAFDVLHSPPVAARVAELRAIAAEALNTSVAELALQAHEMATADVGELAPVEVYACRVCHSADGRHPAWQGAGEFADAVERWQASLDSPKPEPQPDARGGFDYDPLAAPSASCRACRGHGLPVLRIVPTAELSAGARRLYAGVTVRTDGTVERVLADDRAKWAHMRNQLIGAYAPTKVEGRHAHLHIHRQAPDQRVPMSVDEALAALEHKP